ncbi:uncharacterized protein BP5553_07611 [Venustampulla echinocandica]|uniref:Reverse transcriptase domain-containing protein n=1 Tax=Venustampulla echinocandica TaxID=2656787 RepID=A0A370TH22_9HELO|nr:uncharacterized protein BP5553_07611 [Venustampulla echinocandica]RDL34483.1 hypothetical protein BP5553_07611 [Venustampulla echinocandica]
MTDGELGLWRDNFETALLADRVTVKATTGFSPFYLQHRSEAALPIETRIPTWRTFDWENVQSTADLLALRARQIQLRDADLEEAAAMQKRMRAQGKEQFDRTRRIRITGIKRGDIVLLHDALQEKDMSSRVKLGYRWLGPFRVAKAFPDKGTYMLEELDGTMLKGTFAGRRLKAFRRRGGVLEPVEIGGIGEGDATPDAGHFGPEREAAEPEQETIEHALSGDDEGPEDERLRPPVTRRQQARADDMER